MPWQHRDIVIRRKIFDMGKTNFDEMTFVGFVVWFIRLLIRAGYRGLLVLFMILYAIYLHFFGIPSDQAKQTASPTPIMVEEVRTH